MKRWVFLGIILTFCLGITSVSATLTEVETKCGMFDCYTVLETSFNIPAVYIGETFNSEDLPDTYKKHHIGRVENIFITVVSKNIVNITGDIKGTTQNLWGIVLLGDNSHENSTWWNSSWNWCLDFEYNSSLIDYAETDMPLLLRLNSTYINYNNTNGTDIRIVNTSCENAGSLLPHHIEKWNESGESQIWFLADNLDNTTDKNFSVYYNNTLALDIQNEAGVWDGSSLDFILVHLLQEAGTPVYDSTTNNYDGTVTGAVAHSSGHIDGAFYMTDDRIACGNDQHLTDSETFSVGAWINLDIVNENYMRIISLEDGGWGWFLGMDDTIGNKGMIQLFDGSPYTAITTSTMIINNWYFIVGTYDGTNIEIYFNGVSEDTNIGGYDHDYDEQHCYELGAYGTGCDGIGATDQLEGLLDTIWVSDVELSASQVKILYENQKENSQFFTYGSEQEQNITTTTTTIISYPGGFDWSTDWNVNFWVYGVFALALIVLFLKV